MRHAMNKCNDSEGIPKACQCQSQGNLDKRLPQSNTSATQTVQPSTLPHQAIVQGDIYLSHILISYTLKRTEASDDQLHWEIKYHTVCLNYTRLIHWIVFHSTFRRMHSYQFCHAPPTAPTVTHGGREWRTRSDIQHRSPTLVRQGLKSRH